MSLPAATTAPPPSSSQVVVRTILRNAHASHHHRRIARDLVWQWAARRWPRLMPDRALQEDENLLQVQPGRSLRVTTSQGGAAWALEVSTTERDGSNWTTTALVADGGQADVFALETRCADAPPTRVVAPPKVLSSWVQRLALEDAGVPVTGEARVVESEQDVTALRQQLLDPARRMPVVALANKPGTRWYGIDPRGIAEALRGLAHVVCVQPEAVASLVERFGRSLSPAAGAVRIYLPGFAEGQEARAHPMLRPRKPTQEDDPAVSEATAFRRYVCHRVCELGAAGEPGLEGLLGAAA